MRAGSGLGRQQRSRAVWRVCVGKPAFPACALLRDSETEVPVRARGLVTGVWELCTARAGEIRRLTRNSALDFWKTMKNHEKSWFFMVFDRAHRR